MLSYGRRHAALATAPPPAIPATAKDAVAVVAAMSARIAKLESENAVLRGDGRITSRFTFRTTPAERRILDLLMSRSPNCVRSQAIGRAGALSDNVQEDNLAKAHICNLRRKLPDGVAIETMWGEGFYIDTTSREILEKTIIGGAA